MPAPRTPAAGRPSRPKISAQASTAWSSTVAIVASIGIRVLPSPRKNVVATAPAATAARPGRPGRRPDTYSSERSRSAGDGWTAASSGGNSAATTNVQITAAGTSTASACHTHGPQVRRSPAPCARDTNTETPVAAPTNGQISVQVQIPPSPTAPSSDGPSRPTIADDATCISVSESICTSTGEASSATSRTPPPRGAGDSSAIARLVDMGTPRTPEAAALVASAASGRRVARCGISGGCDDSDSSGTVPGRCLGQDPLPDPGVGDGVGARDHEVRRPHRDADP